MSWRDRFSILTLKVMDNSLDVSIVYKQSGSIQSEFLKQCHSGVEEGTERLEVDFLKCM